ncbi:UBX domain-containing protein 4 isoform X2 [Spodoptera frugiperda]|uniref:UBX domain-containing protein 4 n=1 Tax=Spodoptera frugiperda TaxID=7108 RepID=A0A9R0F0V2_SPOFR|nr:UBX domain-containing protein 4 isoform X2 [Spodoptera frugiperda]
MHWYGGSIAEAVTLSKQRNAIFVVFVEGENDLSVEMAATIDDAAVLSRLSDQSNFLAIKLKSGSPNYNYFAQIYQFVPVPSLFFIGRNGMPLEVVCAGVQASNLALRIDRILEQHFKDKQPSPTSEQSATEQVQPSTSSTNLKEQTGSFVQTETAAMVTQAAEPVKQAHDDQGSPPPKIPKVAQESKPLTPDDMECDGDVCVRRPSKADEAGPSQAPTPILPSTPGSAQAPEVAATESLGSMEEKMERAKELIEARRREKADKEKELEKEKEMERRAQGKGVAELKRWQADQELKQIQEERRREKMENNLARQRILEQIAQDRRERRARDAPPAATAATAPAAPATQTSPTAGDVGTGARIQFKLPDGTSHTAHFHADGTLADVQRYVADNLQLSTSSFALWTAFPRRELTEATASLRGLQLAPSAALLVLPRRTPPTVARPSAVASIITFFTQLFTTMILEPSQTLLVWLRTRLFPPPATSPRTPRAPSPAPPAPPGGVRRRGNIHRLPSDRAPDDDNNTWNGNSTQQM